jgi:hypothetical protein
MASTGRSVPSQLSLTKAKTIDHHTATGYRRPPPQIFVIQLCSRHGVRTASPGQSSGTIWITVIDPDAILGHVIPASRMVVLSRRKFAWLGKAVNSKGEVSDSRSTFIFSLSSINTLILSM